MIPLALVLLWGRFRTGLYFLYLAVVGIADHGIGIGLLFGLKGVTRGFEQASDQQWFSWLTLALGVVLALCGILARTPPKREPGAVDVAPPARLLSGSITPPWGIMAIAAGAAVAESATMLPHLGAMAMIESMEIPLAGKILWTAGYCSVMVLPAVLIGLAARLRGQGVNERIRRASPRLAYEGRVTLLWIAAIVGLHLAFRSALRLGLLNGLG